MDQRDDVLLAADRLFFSCFCDLWPRGDAHSGRRPDSRHREPAFCVLPDGATPAPKAHTAHTAYTAHTGKNAEPVDGGMW